MEIASFIFIISVSFILGVLFTLEKIDKINESVRRQLVNDFKIWFNKTLKFETREEKIQRLTVEYEELGIRIDKLEEEEK